MPSSFAIRLEAADLVFTAHHFVALGEGVCVEPLHAHDFRVVVTIAGPLDPFGVLIDFHRASAIVRDLLAAWHHRALLPRAHPAMTCRNEGGDVVITLGETTSRWPASDIVRLDVVSVSTELLAATLVKRLRIAFVDASLFTVPAELYHITVALHEADGCWAIVQD